MINSHRIQSTQDIRSGSNHFTRRPLRAGITCIATVLCLVVHSASASPVYGTYYNERYSFSISYPSRIVFPGRPPDNSDGRVFTSKNGDVTLTASGGLNINEDSIATLYTADKSDADLHPANLKITYCVLRSTWYAYSGYANGKVYYQKTYLTKDSMHGDSVFHTMIFVYPQSKSAYFDPIAAKISHSFHPCSSPEGATLVG